jgi:AraC family transcriptional regulator
MQRPATRESYAERIDRVLRLIAEDIDRELRYDDLAAVACFSGWHFHRVYRGVTGETVDETVRRLRLHRAAYELNATALPMDRIARRAGYTSLAAFSRAFKADYAVAPSSYRRTRAMHQQMRNRAKEDQTVFPVELSKTDALKVVGLPHQGDYNSIGTTFDRVSALAAAKGLFGPHTRMFGIYFDSPEDVPVARLRSFAGLTCPPGFASDADLQTASIAAGPFAAVLHKGPYAELHKVYDWLFRGWLPVSGRDPGNAPPFEEYLNNPRELPPTEWLTRVCIPLAT